MTSSYYYNDLSRNLYLEYAPRINSTKNFIMGTDGALLAFEAFYYGTGGKTRVELDKKRFTERYSIPHNGSTFVVVLSREDVGDIKPQFEKDVKANCTKNFFHKLVKNEELVKDEENKKAMAVCINKRVDKKSGGVVTEIVNIDDMNMETPILTITAITFNATLFENGTTEEDFFVPDSPKPKKKAVMMMKMKKASGVALVSGMEKELRATTIKFLYNDSDGSSFIAIMPNNQPATKAELLNLLSTLDLERFLSSFQDTKCNYQSMPRFTTKTDVKLIKDLGNIKPLVDFSCAEFSNMFDRSGFVYEDGLEFCVKTTINNTNDINNDPIHVGTRRIEKFAPDIILNQPFLYFIVDCKHYIKAIGTFLEPC